jgi:hypothetical protein
MLFSAVIFLLTAAVTDLWVPTALVSALEGLVLGAALGTVGIWVSRWENTRQGLHYTPNRWMVLVITLGMRTVEGAVNAAGAFAIFDTLILKGTFLGWILRSPDRIPGIFPISPKWRFVLFGLGAVQFARHPEGLVEAGTGRSLARAERRAAKRAERSSPPPEPPTSAPPLAVEEPVP